LYCIEIFKVA